MPSNTGIEHSATPLRKCVNKSNCKILRNKMSSLKRRRRTFYDLHKPIHITTFHFPSQDQPHHTFLTKARCFWRGFIGDMNGTHMNTCTEYPVFLVAFLSFVGGRHIKEGWDANVSVHKQTRSISYSHTCRLKILNFNLSCPVAQLECIFQGLQLLN